MSVPLKAFVLKCPECGAPQPGPESLCRYCKVLLMWAPERSLSRDDGRDFEIEDDPDVEMLALGPTAIAAGAEYVIQRQPQRVFRPLFVWVNPRNAEHFYLSVRIRNIVLMDAPLLGSLFARGRGLPIQSDTLCAGECISVVVTNKTVNPAVFEGCIRGRYEKPQRSPSFGPYMEFHPLGSRPKR